MKKVTIICFLVLIGMLSLQAQENGCGVGLLEGRMIKDRLLENRNLFSEAQVADLMTNRSTIYVPVSIHNVAGDASGLGKTSDQTIMALICGLNAIYANQDVQFYIYNTIHNHISADIYDNASTTASRNDMMSYLIPGTVNMIIGSSINNPTASWYSPWGDYIFILKQMMTPAAKTEAHEVGHFFTLPHTFYDWEGTDASTYGSGNVPCTIGSGQSAFQPERFARTGAQANCTSRGDGFCDTPADYYSNRKACPYNATVHDCYGNLIVPDDSNIMSYAYDNCVTQFSTEQKAAVAMDIASRTWVSNTPSGTGPVTGTPAAVSPLNNAAAAISSPTVRLEWTPITNASWYYLEVYGTTTPGLWIVNLNDVKFKGFVTTGNAYYDLPTAGLTVGARYAWRVKALNEASTCAPVSGYNRFQATSVTSIKDLPIEQQMSFAVNNNPITTSAIPFSVYTAEEVVASLRIYSMDGREVIAMTKQVINEGDNMISIPAENLSNGMYVAVLSSDRGVLQQKLIIQR